MKVGEQIRKIRRDSGKTLEDLAFYAGTDAGNLSRIERGQQACSADMLAQIAFALGVSIADFFQPDPNATVAIRDPLPRPPRPKPSLDEELQRRYHDLSLDNRELALAFIKLLARRQAMPSTQATLPPPMPKPASEPTDKPMNSPADATDTSG